MIETEQFRITPGFTGYANELANWPDENFMMPEGKISGTSPYSASDEKVMLYGEVQIEYIGSDKSDVQLSVAVQADYDDGYQFNEASYGSCVTPDDWSYTNIMSFEPLSSATTRTLRYCMRVPSQVEANPDKPLLVTFVINGESYVFDFRSAEVRSSDFDPRGEFYQPVNEETKNRIVEYLKTNGLEQMGWYDKTVGVYTFTFGDTDVSAILPINSDYQYEFHGTYEVYSGAILLNWDHGEQMHLDYTFDGTTLTIVEFGHDR